LESRKLKKDGENMSKNYIEISNDKWDCRIDNVNTEAMQEFYEWLQGKRNIDRMYFVENPHLSKEAAFSVIYYLQERLGVLEDKYEVCKDCGHIYDSYYEGTTINHEDKNFTEDMYGHYCDDCILDYQQD